MLPAITNLLKVWKGIEDDGSRPSQRIQEPVVFMNQTFIGYSTLSDARNLPAPDSSRPVRSIVCK